MRRSQAGFTLMELMVVIVIVAILAAVAVPLYINYVKDAQRTEAKGVIAAIVTAEQVHLQRYGAYIAYEVDDFKKDPTTITDASKRLDVDVREATNNWDLSVAVTDDQDEFTITAEGIEDRASTKGLKVIYHYKRSAPDVNPWTET
jgi:prepilin-type N-terminal cleavage/methylation domain-containing protein